MKSRIAVLVLAHRTAPLPYVAATLDARFRLFIHLDAKTAAAPPILPPHANYITPRIEVFWGGWSMIQATRALIAAAQAEGGFSRYVLISGDTLPAIPQNRLEAALLDPATEFIDLIEVPNDPTLAGTPMQNAIEKHGWVQPWRRHNLTTWDHRLLNPFERENAAQHYNIPQDRIDWIRGDLEHLTRNLLANLHPEYPFETFHYGAQWWALTHETLSALLPTLDHPATQRFFRYIQVPDEHLFQTALANRPDLLEAKTLKNAPIFTAPGPRPPPLSRQQFTTAASHGPHILFARKFAPEFAPDVAALIERRQYESEVLVSLEKKARALPWTRKRPRAF